MMIPFSSDPACRAGVRRIRLRLAVASPIRGEIPAARFDAYSQSISVRWLSRVADDRRTA